MTDSEKALQVTDSFNFGEITDGRTSLVSRRSLIRRLKTSKEARARFVSSYIDKGIAYQIRAIRDHQELSQIELGQMVGMNQNAISRLESPWYGKATIRTLKRLAEAFDVGLVIRFVPFSKLTNWVSETPYVEEGMSAESLAVRSFVEDTLVQPSASKTLLANDVSHDASGNELAPVKMFGFPGRNQGDNKPDSDIGPQLMKADGGDGKTTELRNQAAGRI
jgi:transcriptional regulator with XRE-family HTH domain